MSFSERKLVLAALLESRPDLSVNCRDIHGYPLIYYAASLGDKVLVEDLIARGVDVSRCVFKQPSHTPILAALQSGHIDIAELLYAKQTDSRAMLMADIENPDGRAWLREKLRQEIALATNPQDTQFQFLTPKGTLTYYETLLARVIDLGDIDKLNEKDVNRYLRHRCENPLLRACSVGKLDMVKQIFVRRKVTGEKPSPPYSMTYLQMASKYNRLNILEWLISEGEAIDAVGKFKQTALQMAIVHHALDAACWLLARDASITHQDIDGRDALMLCAIAGNAVLMRELLAHLDAKICLSRVDIYGYNAIDYAVLQGNRELLKCLAPEQFDALCRREDFASNPPKINQRELLRIFSYYFELIGREPHEYQSDFDIPDKFTTQANVALFVPKGHCNGFSWLKHLYGAEYFFSTLALMCSWDGTQAMLEQPLSPDIPQAKFYGNLKALFEQWINDIIWFQHSAELFLPITLGVAQDERIKQVKAVSAKPEDVPVYFYRSRICRINTAQLQDLCQLFSHLPHNMHVEFSGADHATGALKNPVDEIEYYDPNFLFTTTNTTPADYEALANNVLNYKYIRMSFLAEDDSLEITWDFFCFSGDYPALDKTLDAALEEAMKTCVLSATAYTGLHIAVMFGRHALLEKLLHADVLDVNQVDAFGITPLDMALEKQDEKSIALLLAQPALAIGDLPSLRGLYLSAQLELLKKLIEHPNSKGLDSLFLVAIERNDEQLVKKLMADKKIDIPALSAKIVTTVIRCTQPNMLLLLLDCSIDWFIETKNIFGDKVTAISELTKWVFKRNRDLPPELISKLIAKIAECMDVGKQQDILFSLPIELLPRLLAAIDKERLDKVIPGKIPLLFRAVKSGDLERFALLLDKGANPNLTTKSGKHLLAVLLSHKHDLTAYARCLIKAGADLDFTNDANSVSPRETIETSKDPKIQALQALINPSPEPGS